MTTLPGTTDSYSFHLELARFNVTRMAIDLPSVHSMQWQDALHMESAMRLAEGKYLEALRAQVAPLLPPPSDDSQAFADWFESLECTGPGQHHSLFDWLAEQATLPQMRWFLTQEAVGEAGFEDLVALAQIKLPVQAKLECARNYWDEMGHGKAAGMHGLMLERMVAELGLESTLEDTVWQSLALSNTMLGLALTRRYAYHVIGALGAIELTAPARATKVSNGMRRLGIDGRKRAYFDLHGALDVSHARAWIREIIRPLVDANPACAPFIAEGALMRLVCGARCYQRYSTELLQPRPQMAARQRMPKPARVLGMVLAG
ncbi:MAG: iron-containing redox enzyme family protein [Burkholderiales bacterium]